MQECVAYYRVSTDRQGASGLGLEAQRAGVARYLVATGKLVAVFTEVEAVEGIQTGPSSSQRWKNVGSARLYNQQETGHAKSAQPKTKNGV